MKSLTAAALALLSLSTTSSALPATQKRTPGGIYMCTGANFTGECQYITVPFESCQTLSAPYYKNLGSFGPDAGAYCRITYTADSCTLHGDAFVQVPGVSDLHSFLDPATDTVVDAGSQITSFLCQECSECT